jgi:transposase
MKGVIMNSQQNGTININEFTLDEKPKKLSKVEKKKLRVITQLINGEINGTQAAEKLGITTRQVRNLKRQVLNEGRDGVIHKNKNYKPYNTYDEEIGVFVCKIYRKSYRGTNFSEFARIIQEEYGVQASRSTIYNFLRKGRIRSPQRKAKKRKVISYDEQGNKIIQIVRIYDRKTTNNPSGKKVVASTTIKPARKPRTTTKKTTTKKTTKK